jgi:hypothetical protein
MADGFDQAIRQLVEAVRHVFASEKKGIDGEFRILKDDNALPQRGGGFSVAGVCDTGSTSLPE